MREIDERDCQHGWSDTQHEWQPIETYDKLKKKPKYAAFWFDGTAPARGQNGKYGLEPMMSLERFRGSRICTLWIRLPDPTPNIEVQGRPRAED